MQRKAVLLCESVDTESNQDSCELMMYMVQFSKQREDERCQGEEAVLLLLIL